MPQELIYTSAPRGLDQGAFGFCTVQRTAGLDRVVQRQLEALSAFSSNSGAVCPRDVEIVLHTSVVGPAGICRVLSKVSAGGEDYSGRSNLLAHHLVFSPAECPPCGPALLARVPGVMKSSWDGRVSQIASRNLPPIGSSTAASQNLWQSSFGDSGWVGVVLFELSRQNSQPVWVIVPDGTDSLRLIAELSSCLEPDERWNVTFATEYQPLPAGTQCILRFVSRSSPLVDGLIRRGGSGTIDLSRRRASIPTDAVAMVDEVRAGRSVRLKSRTVNLTNSKTAGQPDRESDLLQMALQESRQRNRSANATAAVATPGLISSSDSAHTSYARMGDIPANPTTASRRNLFRITGLAALALATLAICGTGTATIMYVKRERQREETARLASKARTDKETRESEEKLARKKFFEEEKKNLHASLEKAIKFVIPSFPPNQSVPDQDANLLPDSVTKFRQRLPAAETLAKELEDELGANGNKYREALKGYNDAPPITDVVADDLGNLCDEAAEGMKRVAESLNAINSATKLIGLHDEPKSREVVTRYVAILSDLKAENSCDMIRPMVTDPEGVQALTWIGDRIKDLQAFSLEKPDFNPLPFELEEGGFLVHVPCQKTSEGSYKATLLIPERMKDIIEIDDIKARPADREQGGESFVLLHITAPDSIRKSAISTMLCVHLTGDLIDKFVVRELQAVEYTEDWWTPEILCRVQQLNFYMPLWKKSKRRIIGQGVQRSKESQPILMLDLKLDAEQAQAAAATPVTLTGANPSDAPGFDARKGLTAVIDEHSLAFWTQTLLEPDGLTPADPQKTPGQQWRSELENDLKEKLENAANRLVDSLQENHWKKTREATKDEQLELNKVVKELLEHLTMMLKTPGDHSTKWHQLLKKVEDKLKENKCKLEVIRPILEAASKPNTSSSLEGPIADQSCEKWYSLAQAIKPLVTQSSQSSPETIPKILAATTDWIEVLTTAQQTLATLKDPQLSMVIEECQWFETVREQTVTLNELQLAHGAPAPQKLRIIKLEPGIHVKLPVKSGSASSK